MNLRSVLPVALLCAAAALPSSTRPALAAQTAESRGGAISAAADTGQFLPPDALLARVDDRRITARDFVKAYFNSYAEFRPAPDSAGRTEFLNSMVTKEILAKVAKKVNKPLTFEDRLTLKGYKDRMLSNVLFNRVVLDSVHVPESEIRRVYQQYTEQLLLRHIVFKDSSTAKQVRLQLLRGQISWSNASKKYSVAFDPKNPDGNLGWKLRVGMDTQLADELYVLRPGEISGPVLDADGYHLVQCLDRKKYPASSLESLRTHINDELRSIQVAEYSRRFKNMMAKRVHMTYDSTAIHRFSARFTPPRSFVAGEITVNDQIPDFSPQDTATVLARYDGGQLTLGALLAAYTEVTPIMRPAMHTFDDMISQVQSTALGDERLREARKRGLESDPMMVKFMDRRVEQMRVEAMYQDSVVSHVRVTDAQRHAYYEAHKPGFFTYPKVRYAVLTVPSRARADSVEGVLRASKDIEGTVDHLRDAGVAIGGVEDRTENQHGPNQNILFKVLNPGETTVAGPDRDGHFFVIHLLSRDSGHQLSFTQVTPVIDESLRNIEAEKLLKEFTARHRPNYDVEIHPELVMKIRMVDPELGGW